MQITYQKNDGCIFKRYRNTMLPYKIGDITSMGWKVLNIEYKYKDRYYPEYKYNMILYKNKQTCIKMKRARELCIKHIIIFLYYIIAALVINFLKGIIGI